MMNEKEIFFKDKENCSLPLSHVEDGEIPPELKYVDELYGIADALSIENAMKHERNLKYLAILGTLVAIFFLLYGEARIFWLVFGCALLIFIIIFINQIAEKSECHRKYTQYRVLAESLRVQYFISLAGIDKNVSEILPWFTKKGIQWVDELLSELPPVHVKEKKPIINCWIRNQRDYHEKKFKSTKKTYEKDRRIKNMVLYVTILTYIIAVIFEVYMYIVHPGELNFMSLGWILNTVQPAGVMIHFDQVELIRAILKIILGTMSAATLFTGSYYGNMSLSNISEDHRRMIMLYEYSIHEIKENNGEESEELILRLAREFLIENSTWYAYQKNNKQDLTFE